MRVMAHDMYSMEENRFPFFCCTLRAIWCILKNIVLRYSLIVQRNGFTSRSFVFTRNLQFVSLTRFICFKGVNNFHRSSHPK